MLHSTSIGDFLWWSLPEANMYNLGNSLDVCLLLACICLILNWITSEYSWVDRLWSITPIVYSWMFTMPLIQEAYNSIANVSDVVGLLLTSRNAIVSLLITCWGLRLTYNFARKGGYQYGQEHAEDYRWKFVKSIFQKHETPYPKVNKIMWESFNIGFICFYQHLLLWLIVFPQWYRNYTTGDDQILEGDRLSIFFFIVYLCLESRADQEQWDFHQDKASFRSKLLSSSMKKDMKGHAHLKSSPTDLENGFLTKGLWGYSRHPNFLCEQLIWVTVWSFTWWSTITNIDDLDVGLCLQAMCNPASIGAILLILLFQGSTRLTEQITAGKYPKYAAYQAKVGILLPDVFGIVRGHFQKVIGNKIAGTNSTGKDISPSKITPVMKKVTKKVTRSGTPKARKTK